MREEKMNWLNGESMNDNMVFKSTEQQLEEVLHIPADWNNGRCVEDFMTWRFISLVTDIPNW